MGMLIATIIARTGWTEKAARAAAYVAFGLLLLVLVSATLTLSRCSRGAQERAQARVTTGQADAYANSVADAVATQQAAQQRETTSEELTRTNEQEIRNAPGANDPVNPAARDAGLRSLCKRATYRDSERCKLFRPPPR